MTSTTPVYEKPAPIKATWITLGIAWLLFLLPIPGAGLFVGWPLNLVAFILAIVVMSRGRTMAGLIPLISSLIVSPIVYFIGLAIFGAAIGGGDAYKDYTERAAAAAATTGAQAQTEEVAAPELIAVSSQQLLAAYEANEVAADNLYKGKGLAVTGRVDGINKDFMDQVYVLLDTGNEFQTIQAHGLSADVAAGLQKGQSVTLECVGDGFMIGSPVLNACKLR